MTDYALALSAPEVQRYRAMAARARAEEAELWRAAGIVPGARVADIGCGPGAVLVELAQIVGTAGSVVGVDGDPEAVATARRLLDEAGVADAEVRVGAADRTDLAPGTFDVVVMRHVLAHNGSREQAIVGHLATLVRPGGAVYLVDIDGAPVGVGFDDPDVDDLNDRYAGYHALRGNDLRVGARLGRLLRTAGLDLVRDDTVVSTFEAPPGVRPPAFAAAEAMVEARIATPADVERWRAALDRLDARPTRPAVQVTLRIAIGRRPG